MKNIVLGLHSAVIPQADLKAGLLAASAAGFSVYEPEAARLSNYTQNRVQRNNKLRRSLNLQWGPLNELQVFDPEIGYDNILDLAVELGTQALTVIPEPSDISFDEAVRELRRLRAHAESRGLSLYFEMLCFREHPFHTWEQSMALARAARVQLVVDTFHLIGSGASAEEIAKIPKEMVGVVHISDALKKGKHNSELVDEDRVLPGEGDLDLVTVMDALRRTNYKGLMTVEVFHPRYAQEKAASVAVQAFQRSKILLEKSGWIK
jgi:sugar phosphate isomerase/epimerase